jgi:hypothetical protein
MRSANPAAGPAASKQAEEIRDAIEEVSLCRKRRNVDKTNAHGMECDPSFGLDRARGSDDAVIGAGRRGR